MTAFLVLIVFTTLAVARLSRLLTIDKVGEPVRNWVLKKNSTEGSVTYLVFCFYCVSVWFAALVTPFVWFLADGPEVLGITSWVGLPLTALAVAYGASFIIAKEDR